MNYRKLASIIIGIVVAATIGYFYFTANYSDSAVIGIIVWANDPEYSDNIQGFKDGLKKMGYIEGLNISYILENANFDDKRQKEALDSFIEKKVDVIYSLTTTGTLIAKDATKEIPIVFSIVTFPVQAGIIKSFDNSENNLVGTSNYIKISEQFDLFYQIFPVKKIGFVHRNEEPNSIILLHEMKEHATIRGVEVIQIASDRLEDAESAITNAIDEVDALYQACDTMIQNGGEEIAIKIATDHKKPTFSCLKAGVLKGSLVGSVAEPYFLGDRAGQKAGLILNGVNPSDLFSEIQEDPIILINLKTAKKLGITIPEEILVRANQIIR